MPSPPLISIVFSSRNEAGNIAEVTSQTERVFSTEPKDYEAFATAPRFGVYDCIWAWRKAASGDPLTCKDTDPQDPPEITRE